MVSLSVAMVVTTLVVAWIYDLPVHDPDSTVAPTYLRLPVFLLVAFLADVLPRALWRSVVHQHNLLRVRRAFVTVTRERWDGANLRFALLGLGAWYLTYASFRNLKSYVPFVNPHLWDGVLDDLDRILWFGHDPADVLHSLLGTGVAAHVLSVVYIAWIVFVPASLVVALVWSRDARAGAWYVTAVAVDWVLGVATYFALPTLGPVYATPSHFADLTRTDVTALQETMMQQRHEVLVNPMTTDTLQTIAAFASLHVGICVTMCLMAELVRLPRLVRVFLWAFLAITVVSTVYLGWHYFVDTLGGAVLGVAGVWIAARGTGNAFRRREPAVQPVAIPVVSRAA
jgi:hypothetical protein